MASHIDADLNNNKSIEDIKQRQISDSVHNINGYVRQTCNNSNVLKENFGFDSECISDTPLVSDSINLDNAKDKVTLNDLAHINTDDKLKLTNKPTETNFNNAPAITESIKDLDILKNSDNIQKDLSLDASLNAIVEGDGDIGKSSPKHTLILTDKSIENVHKQTLGDVNENSKAMNKQIHTVTDVKTEDVYFSKTTDCNNKTITSNTELICVDNNIHKPSPESDKNPKEHLVSLLSNLNDQCDVTDGVPVNTDTKETCNGSLNNILPTNKEKTIDKNIIYVCDELDSNSLKANTNSNLHAISKDLKYQTNDSLIDYNYFERAKDFESTHQNCPNTAGTSELVKKYSSIINKSEKKLIESSNNIQRLNYNTDENCFNDTRDFENEIDCFIIDNKNCIPKKKNNESEEDCQSDGNILKNMPLGYDSYDESTQLKVNEEVMTIGSEEHSSIDSLAPLNDSKFILPSFLPNLNIFDPIDKTCLKLFDKSDNKDDDSKSSNVDFSSMIEENDLNDKQEDSCSGYHSSDFEFITEDEAVLEGMVNKNGEDKNYNTLKIVNITPDTSRNSSSIKTIRNPLVNDFNVIQSYRNVFQVDNSYRQNHVIPHGDNYAELFEGYPLIQPYLLENKCAGTSSMFVENEGIGFNIRFFNRQDFDSDNEFKEEADQNAKLIMKLYPRENKKRRRRF